MSEVAGYPLPWITGAPIKRLRKGWARMVGVGMRTHYWEEDTATMLPKVSDGGRVRYYSSLCGLSGVTNDRVPAFHGGSWPPCKACKRKEAKRERR